MRAMRARDGNWSVVTRYPRVEGAGLRGYRSVGLYIRLHDEGPSMRKQYLHLSVFLCDKCNGPVVAGSLAIRENALSKATDISQVGAICLSCGHRQSQVAERGITRQFLPVEWRSENSVDGSHFQKAFSEMLHRAA